LSVTPESFSQVRDFRKTELELRTKERQAALQGLAVDALVPRDIGPSSNPVMQQGA
jgi:hypothetical protein